MGEFPEQVSAHLQRGQPPIEPQLIAELVTLDRTGATADPTFLDKQSDWTYGPDEAAMTPVERMTDHRAETPDAGLDGQS